MEWLKATLQRVTGRQGSTSCAERVLGDGNLCCILLNYAGDKSEARARCVSKHWARLRRPWVATLPQNGRVQTAAFSPDGATLVIAGGTTFHGSGQMYDVRSGALRWEFPRTGEVKSVSFSRDGGTLAVGGHESGQGDRSVALYDARTGTLLRQVAGVAFNQYRRNWVAELAFSRDGATLVVVGHSVVSIYDATTFQLQHEIEYFSPESVAFSSDCATIAFGGQAGNVVVHDVASGTRVCEHDGNTVIRALAFSPSGLLAVGGDDDIFPDNEEDQIIQDQPTLKVYKEAGRTLRSVVGGVPAVYCLAFAPNESVLVAGGLCGSFAVFDVSTLALRSTLWNDDVGLAIAFSPDSSKVAIGGINHKIRLYETETGDPVRVP